MSTHERPQLLPLDSLEHGCEREAQLPVYDAGLLDVILIYIHAHITEVCG